MQSKPGWRYLEKRSEDVGIGVSEEEEGEKGGEAAVEDRRPDRLERVADPLVPGHALLVHESVADVGRVVDGQTDPDDHGDARDRVDREAPEVHQPSDVHLEKKNPNSWLVT